MGIGGKEQKTIIMRFGGHLMGGVAEAACGSEECGSKSKVMVETVAGDRLCRFELQPQFSHP